MHIAAAVSIFALTATIALASSQKHPHFDDKGTLTWHTKLADAKAAAKAADRLIFVEYGRQACGNCRALVERALPAADVKPRLTTVAIGLVGDCDAPEPELQELFRANMAGASALPFVAFLTPEGTWIEGYSGYKESHELLEVLGRAEKSPLLDASSAVRKQLAKHAATATAAVEKGNWKPVLDAAREARKTTGRCDERAAIRTAEQAARSWATKELDAAASEATASNDLAGPRKRLAEVRKHFGNEPEATDAANGDKAILRLAQIREIEALPNPKKDLRERAAESFANSRWAGIFAKPEAPK